MAEQEITQEDLDSLKDGFVNHDFDASEEEPQEEATVKTEESEESTPAEPAPDGEPPEETPGGKFEFTDDKQPEASDDEFVEIVHRGQVIKITREKQTELAQKGYDYDVKVGPHARIAQIIQTDPNVAQVVNDYLQGKATKEPEKFKPLPLSDFESEGDWFNANFEARQEFERKNAPPATAKRQPVDPRVQQLQNVLMSRDPENFTTVAPRLKEIADTHLTKVDRDRVENDIGAAIQFYDFAKKKILGDATPAPPTKPKPAPSFRVRSGGGDAPKDDKQNYPWELSNRDFEQALNKIKGF